MSHDLAGEISILIEFERDLIFERTKVDLVSARARKPSFKKCRLLKSVYTQIT